MGAQTYTDGSVYNGEWIDGQAQGVGKITYADGSVYDGEVYERKA